MTFFINGIGVGKDLEFFDRDIIYKNNLDKIGNSSNNIKIIHNFIPFQVCEELVNITKNIIKTDFIERDGFWDEMVHKEESLVNTLLPYISIIQAEVEGAYEISVKPIHDPYIVKWTPGKALGPHVDDLGTEHNHISTILYLNDEYTGGTVSFLTHNLSIKPKTGDLLIFPGNLNYAHEVTEITSGNRYTAPIWFQYA